MSQNSFDAVVPRSPSGYENIHTSMPSFDEGVFNSLTDAIVVVGTDMRIERMNPAALKLTGFDENDLVGRSVVELTENKRLAEKFMGRAFAGEYPAGRLETRRGVDLRPQ